MSALDEATRQRLLAALLRLESHVRKLTRLVQSQETESPLPALIADMTPQQRRILQEDVLCLHAAMAAIIERHGLAAPQPVDSALQACRVVLHRAMQEVEALTPRRDGTSVSDEAEADLRRLVARLLDPLDDMQRTLAPCDAPAPSGDEDLDTLRRIVRTHGLLQFDAPLARLAERAADPGLMIAVLGRTNAGKSSLINRLLGTDLLPVDAVPATSVPVRVSHGPLARGAARLARAVPDVLTAGRVAEFASERYNPANGKHVEDLFFELPSWRLADGVCLLDVPGWSAGAEPPLCDVGVVLIDATGSLELQEFSLVDGLRRAGSAAIVLLSKADRLVERDRWEVFKLVTERLWAEGESQPPVFFVSSTAREDALWDDWIARGLEPCIARGSELRKESLRCKQRQLRAAIARSLERLASELPAGREQDMEGVRQECLGLIAAARQDGAVPESEARIQALRLVSEVAHNAAELGWQGGAEILQLAPMIEASMKARAAAARQDIVRELDLLATQCADRLAGFGGPPLDWKMPSVAAVQLEAGVLPSALDVPRPWFAGTGTWLLRWYVRGLLHRRRVPAVLVAEFQAHLSALERWRQAGLDDMSRLVTDNFVSQREAAARIWADVRYLQ